MFVNLHIHIPTYIFQHDWYSAHVSQRIYICEETFARRTFALQKKTAKLTWLGTVTKPAIFGEGEQMSEKIEVAQATEVFS